MNGDLSKIYDAINDVKVSVSVIKTKQQENHTMNKEDIGKLFGKFDKLSVKIKCDINEEKIKNVKGQMKFVYGFLTTIVVGGIMLGLWMKAILGG